MCFEFGATSEGEIMKAVRYHSYGDSSVLVYEEADRPVAEPGQVVVKVAGAAFNPLDVGIRGGFVQEVFPISFPHVPNFDVSGVISEVGEGIDGWSAGDAVVAFLPITGPGAAAEYALVPADALAAAPGAVELADAAALPSAGLTAWQSLFECGLLETGNRILINGAGGAVGGYAVQLAKSAGARVTATASGRSVERVRSYGADRVIDYTATPVLEAVSGERFDVVLNLVRTSHEETVALAALAVDGGVLVSTTFPDFDSAERGVRVVAVSVRSDAGELGDLPRAFRTAY
jgi:NADPH:quinone reductase-like Zn-dependent oxidoreductase